MENIRKRYREINDQVKSSYINRYETKHGVTLLELENGKYKELPYNTEVTLKQMIAFVDEN